MPACRHRNVIPSAAALIISYLVAPTLRIVFVIIAMSMIGLVSPHLHVRSDTVRCAPQLHDQAF
jgi:hypothetical protein